MMDKARSILKEYFGYDHFRKGQEDIIRLLLNGENVAGIMPTGGGKSICYQVPAMIFPGLTIVISPLISLMKDQVDALTEVGIPATYINSTLHNEEVQERICEIKNGHYKLLYIAPERLEADYFTELLKEVSISFIAVDEAHCISQWGHDFRPSYAKIGFLINKLAERPLVAALTATATPKVHEDICLLLNIPRENTIKTGFARDNLSFSIIKGQDKGKFLESFLKKNKEESGIIYAATRQEVEKLHERLAKKGYSVAKYHGGMNDGQRETEQQAFIKDDVSIMIATNAFGMGIDKSNIRYVIHYQLPKNMEGYYQEAGRAGRDGLQSKCILLYSAQDIRIQRFLIDQTINDPDKQKQDLDKLQSMINFCHTEDCLQEYILHYFGEEHTEKCGQCSNCTDERTVIDVTVEAQKVLSCMIRMGERFGKTMVAQVLTGSKNKKLMEFQLNKIKTYGLMKEQSAKEISDFIEFLISEQYIDVSTGTMPILKVSNKGKEVLLGKIRVVRKEQIETIKVSENNALFDYLRGIRKQLAEEENVPPFVVFSDQTLRNISMVMPTSHEDFREIKGIGDHKLQKYGDVIIEHILAFQIEEAYSADRKEIHSSEINTEIDKKAKKYVENSHLHTLELWESGLSIKEIAKERQLNVQTVENHLLRCGEEEIEIDWTKFLKPEDKTKIGEAIQKVGKDKLKPIKEELPDEISYFMIKVAIMLEKRNQQIRN
ncbi:DNA helicase RecQ [Niallia circulans]|uniref:DNA helicase RecQ n=1 Tax=Niallia circulans TaxID=1397 RepID=A0A0J1IGK0_NIACI|nr:DNA helicase RecQ [Niallia circulans]KLV25073.1 ATP-dependent DNA helicase [Niallia circulans]PAD89260.1 DNA helicase RecQ [Niallia circulans]